MRQGEVPPADELHRLYVVDDLPMAALMKRYGVGQKRVRGWLADAAIPIRTKHEAGRRRQLEPPSLGELRSLYVTRRLPAYEIASLLGVSTQTVFKWMAEAGIDARRSPLKGRPRGRREMAERPDEATLRRLYETERLSIGAVAAELGATVHLVRTWMGDYAVVARRGGGSLPGPRPRRHPLPSREELHRLRAVEHWSLPELAEHYGVSAPTVRAWLGDSGIAIGGRQRRLQGVTVSELVDRYQSDPSLTVAGLGRQVGLGWDRVASELRAAGVAVDRRRGHGRAVERLGSAERQWVVYRYVAVGWSMRRIARAQDLSPSRVRTVLVAAGVTIVARSGLTREDRLEAAPKEVERSYVTEQLTACQAGEALGVQGQIVLRTGHSYGLPIRQGGRPIVPADVRLIEDLYGDAMVAAILGRHGIPARPPEGGIAARFPVAIPLTMELVRDLYVDAGCSSTHIELLTGQAASTVVNRMAKWNIALRGSTLPPFLVRVRADRRRAWLDQIAKRYQETGSTGRVAWEQGCSQMTVERWLCKAGVTLPGRGQWKRDAQRCRPPAVGSG